MAHHSERHAPVEPVHVEQQQCIWQPWTCQVQPLHREKIPTSYKRAHEQLGVGRRQAMHAPPAGTAAGAMPLPGWLTHTAAAAALPTMPTQRLQRDLCVEAQLKDNIGLRAGPAYAPRSL